MLPLCYGFWDQWQNCGSAEGELAGGTDPNHVVRSWEGEREPWLTSSDKAEAQEMLASLTRMHTS
jgi:hypothetical protein